MWAYLNYLDKYMQSVPACVIDKFIVRKKGMDKVIVIKEGMDANVENKRMLLFPIV